jgi:hypothetical protein
VSSSRRVASGAFKAPKRIPADVRVEYQALYGPAWEVKLTIPAGTTPQRAFVLNQGPPLAVSQSIFGSRLRGGVSIFAGPDGTRKCAWVGRPALLASYPSVVPCCQVGPIGMHGARASRAAMY